MKQAANSCTVEIPPRLLDWYITVVYKLPGMKYNRVATGLFIRYHPDKLFYVFLLDGKEYVINYEDVVAWSIAKMSEHKPRIVR